MRRIALPLVGVLLLAGCDVLWDEDLHPISASLVPDLPTPGPLTFSLQDRETCHCEHLSLFLHFEQVEGVGAISYALLYDADLLELEDALPWYDVPYVDDFDARVDPGQPGKLIVTHRLPDGSTFSGSGAVHVFFFRAVRQGSTRLDFQDVSVVDPRGAELPVSFHGGSVVVVRED